MFISCEDISLCFTVQEVQSYLDPATADEMTLSDAAKAEIILAGKIITIKILKIQTGEKFAVITLKFGKMALPLSSASK